MKYDNHIYALCKHCDHFVDVNESHEDEPAAGFCHYLHLEDGEQGFDHDAEPGEQHTGKEWESLRPDLFLERADGKVGPNSKYHHQRGKLKPTW